MATSEDLQVVHYSQGATFGMHHDSSAFLPRLLTAFYYLNGVDDGGETAFPAADGAMSPNEALALTEPAAAGGGLLVKPEKGAALMWYNHESDGSIDPFAVHAGCRVLAGEKWGCAPPRGNTSTRSTMRPRDLRPSCAQRVRASAG